MGAIAYDPCIAPAQQFARLFARTSGFRFVGEQEWRAMQHTGSMKEWCDEQGIAYVEVEGSTRWGSDWNTQRAAIQAVLNCPFPRSSAE